MSDGLAIATMVCWFVLLAYLGVPVAFALLASTIWGAAFTGIDPASAAGQLFHGVNSIPLLAVPFFLLAGEMLSSANITQRLIDLAQAVVGHIKSGLAQVVTMFSIFFSGISGSSTADVAAMSRVILPAMRKEGYDPAKSAVIIAAASTIANMIPPSIMAIVYGATGGVSITALFLAGVTPGVLVGLGLMLFSYFFGFPAASRPRESLGGVARAFRRSLLPMVVPVIIMGGILGGLFTPTEAGMAAVIYTAFILIPAIRRGHLKELPRDFMAVSVLYALPLLAVAAASAFSYVFAYVQAPQLVSGLVEDIAGTQPLLILFLVVVVFIIAGQFLDAIPAIVVFLPIVKALADLGEINPVHMGVVVIVTLAFGLLTPPYGLSLLMASAFAGVPFPQALKRSFAVYGVFGAVILALVFFPDLALWLPRLLVPEAVG